MMSKKYHKQLIKIFWTISKYLLTRLNIPDNRDLEEAIVELERIYESEEK